MFINECESRQLIFCTQGVMSMDSNGVVQAPVGVAFAQGATLKKDATFKVLSDKDDGSSSGEESDGLFNKKDNEAAFAMLDQDLIPSVKKLTESKKQRFKRMQKDKAANDSRIVEEKLHAQDF